MVGERLRSIRRQKGLSLHDVEARSGMEFKASVLGASGPEGGFNPDEEAALAGDRLGLGPHMLRAETAAVAGAAVLVTKRTQMLETPG